MSECLEACPQIICTKQLPLRLNLVAAYLFILYPKSNHKMLTVQNPKGGGGGGGLLGPSVPLPLDKVIVYTCMQKLSVSLGSKCHINVQQLLQLRIVCETNEIHEGIIIHFLHEIAARVIEQLHVFSPETRICDVMTARQNEALQARFAPLPPPSSPRHRPRPSPGTHTPSRECGSVRVVRW